MEKIVERVGDTPMRLVVLQSRFLKLRLKLATKIIRFAYWVGNMRFVPAPPPTRAERRQKVRELTKGR